MEGTGINSTARITGISKPTILKLLADLGKVCAKYQDEHLKNLPCKRIQAYEVWSFCYAKDKNLPEELQEKFGFGSVWTWTTLCPDSKLIVSWLVGGRDAEYASKFMNDLASRPSSKFQLTTDGHKAYLEAVEDAFGGDIDYSILIKLYSSTPTGNETRYSPSECCGTRRKTTAGNPDRKHVSTSLVERQNLTMRMSMRRFTRLTNAHSKKIENHVHSISLYFMYYNFARIHSTLRITPAMAAGVSDHVWDLEKIVDLID